MLPGTSYSTVVTQSLPISCQCIRIVGSDLCRSWNSVLIWLLQHIMNWMLELPSDMVFWVVPWYRFYRTFRLLPDTLPGEDVQPTDSTTEAPAKLITARMVDALQAQSGTSELLTGLFVALCRGLGLLSRTVCVLSPALLRPDEESLVGLTFNTS